MKIFIFLIFSLFFSSEASALVLSPQIVAERAVGNSFDATIIALTEKKADYDVAKAETPFDWNFSSEFYHKVSRFESLTGLANLEDKTRYWTALLEKKFSTGSNLSLAFTRTMQDSILNPNSSITRPSQAVMDQTDLTLTQDLAPNFFGLVEREALRLAKQNKFKANLASKDSQQDLLLKSMQLFWDAFVAKENLNEASAAEARYFALVEYLAKKANQGFSNPADLPKAKAEHELKKKALKESSLSYLNKINLLLAELNLPLEKSAEVEFKISNEFPPLPQTIPSPPADSRKLQMSRISLDNAEIERRAAKLAGLPTLQFKARASYNGVERLSNQSLSDMSSGNHPEYYLGLTLSMPLWASSIRGEQAQKEVLYMEAETNWQKAQQTHQLEYLQSVRALQAAYLGAVAANEALKNWNIAIKEQDRLFRQGRVDVTQIILDYNSYYRTLSERSQAIGDYHMALNAYAAARDKLVE